VFATWYRTRWLLEHGVVDLRPLITHRYGLAEFERAFAELESGDACKIILDPAPLESAHGDVLEEVAVS
jgi:threonine 3-dehydrogenase